MSYKCLKFSAILILLSPIVLFAQSSIESIHMPISGDTIRYTQATLSSDFDFSVTGANSTWDFSSNLEDVRQDLYEYKDIKNVSWTYAALLGFDLYGLKLFDTIGIALFEFHNVYDFYKNESNQFKAVGRAFTYQGLPISALYTDDDEIYQFPLEYEDIDLSTFSVSLTIPSLAGYSQYGTRKNEVDGWGNVITPYGNISCLRIKTTVIQTDSLVLENVPIPLKFSTTTVSYKWLSIDERIPVLEVSGNLVNDVFAPTTIRFRDNYDETIVDPLLPIIDFSASDLTPAIGDTVLLFQNTENAISYNWTISPNNFDFVNGTDELSDNPQVVFNSSESFDVTLRGSNFFESNTKTKKEYIMVSTVDATKPSLSIEGFEIFPQPSTGEVNMIMKNNSSINKLEIIDMLGNLVYVEEFFGENQRVSLNLTTGLYIARIVAENQYRTQSFSIR